MPSASGPYRDDYQQDGINGGVCGCGGLRASEGGGSSTEMLMEDISAWVANAPHLDDLWPRVEEYLSRAAATIRNGNADASDLLGSVRHRMGWYAAIYYACGGHPQRFCEVYQRLALFLLNDLETNVFPAVLSAANVSAVRHQRFAKRGSEEGLPLPSYSGRRLCEEFVRQYRLFIIFRRVVLSCFGYLDQWYTAKFDLDTISELCVKMYYVVVYERVKDSLVDEIVHLADEGRMSQRGTGDTYCSQICTDVQAALAVLSEIITAVRKCSANDSEVDVESGTPHRKGVTKPEIKGGRSGVVGVGTGCSPSGFDRVSLLRERLEKGSLAEVLKNLSSSAGPSYNGGSMMDGQSSTRPPMAVTGRGGAVLGAVHSARAFIVNLQQPLRAIILDHYGARYVFAMERYYHRERELRLSTQDGRREYLSWVCGCYQLEHFLVKDMRAPFLCDILNARLHHVLLLEVYGDVILDNTFGFRTLLDQWSGPRDRRFCEPPEGHSRQPVISCPVSRLGKAVVEGVEGCDGASLHQSAGAGDESERLEGNELVAALGRFVTVFINTQDEASIALLCSELANKVVVESASLLSAYMKMEEEHYRVNVHQRERHGNDLETTFSHDAARVVVGGLVDIVTRYNGLVRRQFHSLPPMLLAIRDGLREVLNPCRWEPHAAHLTPGGGGNASGLNTLRSPVVEERRTRLPQAYEPTRDAHEALCKLATMRRGRLIPVSRLVATYCDLLASSSGNFRSAFVVERVGDNWACEAPLEGGVLVVYMESVAELASLLDDKDAFLEEYKHLLARRLITFSQCTPPTFSLSVASSVMQPCAEHQRAMVRWLRRVLGWTSTRVLKIMLHDYDLSGVLADAFRQTPLARQLRAGIKAQVLTGAIWPTYTMMSFLPCASLAAATAAFNKYYTATHPSRKLTWIYSQGTANLEAVFPKGSKGIVAETIQSNILILLSDAYNAARCSGKAQRHLEETPSGKSRQFLTGRELATSAGMSFESLRLYLNQLVHHIPYKLVTRLAFPGMTPATDLDGVSVQPEDGYTLNVDFVHKLDSFKLPALQPRWNLRVCGAPGGETTGCGSGSQVSNVAWEGMRRLQVDAAIVKVMKRSRSLRYQDLASAVVLEFAGFLAPSMQCIKTQIEGLIAREFLSRSETDSQVLEYVL